MSDFISHLLDRYLGVGEQVMPFPQARFESNVPFIVPPLSSEESPLELAAKDFSKDDPSENYISPNDNQIPKSRVREQPGSVVGSDEEKSQVQNTVSAIQAQTDDLNKNKIMPPEPKPSWNQPGEFIQPQESKKERGEVRRDGRSGLPQSLPEQNLIKEPLPLKSKVMVDNIVYKDSDPHPAPPLLTVKGESSVSKDKETESVGQGMGLINPQSEGQILSRFDQDSENWLPPPKDPWGKNPRYSSAFGVQ